MRRPPAPRVSRRRLMAGATAFAGATLAARDLSAQALRPGAHQELLAKLVGAKTAQPGKVRLRLPEIAENGNSVALTVLVEHPMTEQSYVKAIHVVTDNNPNPDVMSVYLTPAAGKAEISTRIRLAQTMNVIAWCQLSDGSVWSARTEVKVTIGGCGG